MNDPCDLAHEETIRHEQFLHERQREQQRAAQARLDYQAYLDAGGIEYPCQQAWDEAI